MKKSTFIVMVAGLLTAAATVILPSCTNMFLKDPRAYNRKAASAPVADSGELELTGGIDPFDKTDEWYNQQDSNGDEDNKDKKDFPATDLITLGITGWFDNKNVPTYSVQKNAPWSNGDASKNEKVWSNAPDTEGQGYNITGVTYYRYDGNNANYGTTTAAYNMQLRQTELGNPKLSRFVFYRFTGKGGGIQALDNSLMAIDTFSKFVFSYSEPTLFNSMGAPTKWEPVDRNKHSDGTRYMFYEYDPVGYITKEDSGNYKIELYQWFKDNQAQGKYKPGLGISAETAKKQADKPGKSPFNAHNKDYFLENMKSASQSSFYRRAGEILYTYTISNEGKTITRTGAKWNSSETVAPVTYTFVDGSAKTATEGEYTSSENSTKFSVALGDASNSLTLKTTSKNDEIGRKDIADPGPDFVDRVKGKQYVARNDKSRTYTFSEDGKKLTDSKGGITYTFVQQDSTTRAVYKKDSYQFGDMGSYFGLRLAEGPDNSASNSGYTIYWTDGNGWWSAGTTPTATAGTYPADLAMLITDKFTSDVANKEYKYRDATDSTILWTWKFSSDGKTATKTKTIWRGATTVEKEVTFTEEEYDGNTKKGFYGTNGTNREVGFEKLDNEGGGLLREGGKEYHLTFTDPGPHFFDRVKGATFEGEGGSKYVFSADGKTLDYTFQSKNGSAILGWFENLFKTTEKKYTFHRNYNDSTRTQALYYGGSMYDGLKLSNNDSTIEMTATAGADGGLIWNMTNKATRQN